MFLLRRHRPLDRQRRQNAGVRPLKTKRKKKILIADIGQSTQAHRRPQIILAGEYRDDNLFFTRLMRNN